MVDDEILGALTIATEMRGALDRDWLEGMVRRLDDAGYQIVPISCSRCGRILAPACVVHGVDE